MLSGVRAWYLVLLAGLISLLAMTDLSATTHIIKKGDTLYGLSRAYGVSVDEITKANPDLAAASLRVGQKVSIPDQAEPAAEPPAESAPAPVVPAAPAVYVVRKGDTLTVIARQHQVAVGDLKAWNRLATTQIQVGKKLLVVAPAPPPPTVSGTDAAADEKPSTPPPPAAPPPPKAADSEAGKYLFVSKVKKQIDAPKITRRWKYVVVHHSGSTRGNAAIFNYDHRQRGMENGLAYHFIIGNGTDSRDGEIEVGGRWQRQIKGGHLVTNLREGGVEVNELAIGICLVGNFDKDRPTRNQIAALIELVNYLNRRVTTAGYPSPQFTTHGDIHPRHTDCPGRYFPKAALYRMFGAWRGGQGISYED